MTTVSAVEVYTAIEKSIAMNPENFELTTLV